MLSYIQRRLDTMLEKEVSKKDLVKIKRLFHTVMSETVPLGVADKLLINKVVDEVYEKNFNMDIQKEHFLTLVEVELSKYKF